MRLTRDKARRAMGGLMQSRLSSSSAIRVIKIKPSTPEWPIRIKLKTINFRSSKYTALSYAHEPDADDLPDRDLDDPLQSSTRSQSNYTILCDGKPTRVPKVLWNVLDQLRRLNSDVLIWIDRLCVNFDSREERAAHVNMMSHIYANASHVIVWLGGKTASTDDTVLCMRKLVNAIDWRKIPTNFVADFRDAITYARFGMDRITMQQWNNIYNFCHAKWFSELWAFYELASAKQAMFLVGNCYMDYDFLMDFAMVLGLTGWLEGLSQMATDGYDEDSVGLTKMLGPVATIRAIPTWHPQHVDHVKWMKNEYGLHTDEERAWKFLELLMETCERYECQDQRDRILAPLAYVKRVYAGKPINKSWPIVDYETSVETMYSHFANMIHRHTHAPSILATSEYQQIQRPPSSPAVTRGRTQKRILLD